MSNKLSLLVNFKGVDGLSGSIRNIIALGRRGSQSLNDIRGQGKRLEAQLKDVRKELAGSSGNVTALIDRERDLERQIAETNQQLERRKRLNAIEADQAAMLRRGQDMQQRGQEHMVGGAAMLVPFGLLVKAGMDYEMALTRLGQKLSLTTAQQSELGGSMLQVARDAHLQTESVLQGADFLASQGFGVAQLKATMPAIAKFAKAWDSDVTDGAKAAYASTLSLGVSVNQTARALEIMGVAGREGGFEVRDMAQHFPILASNLATLGGEGLPAVASLSAALQVLKEKTGDGAMAANDLGNMMTFVKTEQGIKNFRKFGIDIVAEMKRAEREGRDPLQRLAELTEQATGGDNSKIALLFTDSQAGRAALGLVTSLEKFKKIRDAAFSAQGVTAEEFGRMSKTTASNWTDATTSLSVLSIALGTHLLPLVTKGINALGSIANAVGTWAKENPTAAKTILYMVGGLGAFRVVLGAAMWLVGGFLGPFGTMIGFFKKVDGVSKFTRTIGIFKNALSTAAPVAMRAFGVMRTGALFLAKGVMRAGLMMLANPIVLVITAIVAAIGVAAYLIYTHWDTIKAAFQNGVQWITDKFSALPSWLQNIGKMMMTGLLHFLTPGALVTRLLSIAKSGVLAFKNYFGIKSPSRLFMALGGHMTDGLGIGIDRGGRRPLASMGRLATGVAAAGALSLTPAHASAAGGAGRHPAPASAAPTITFNIYQQPGEDGEALARRIAEIISRRPPPPPGGAYVDTD